MANGSQPAAPAPTCCEHCGSRGFVKWGKDERGFQRFKCKNPECRRTFAARPPRPLGALRTSTEKALLVLNLMSEGMAMRSIERVSGVHRNTQGRILAFVGLKADLVMADLIKDVEVADVQIDEAWSFTAMKRKTQEKKGLQSNPLIGDSWVYFGVERMSKLVLAHHVAGAREDGETFEFCAKLASACAGTFQLSSDGLPAYPKAIANTIGDRASYGQIIKRYGETDEESRRKFSPPQIISIEKRPVTGSPDEDMICTSHCERLNGTFRRWNQRCARLTYAFSKQFKQHCRSVSLFVFAYNFCRVHSSIKTTPAVAAGLTSRAWTFADLLAV